MQGKIISVVAFVVLVFTGLSIVNARGFGPGPNCLGSAYPNQARSQVTFQDLDANADGFISEQEHVLFRANRQASRPGRGRHQLNNMNNFRYMDGNGDDMLSPDEFNQNRAP